MPVPTDSPLVNEILDIADALVRAGAKPDSDMERVNFWRFPEIEQRIEEVAYRISALNPTMTSQWAVANGVRWGVLSRIIRNWPHDIDIRGKQVSPQQLARDYIEEQRTYSKWTTIEVPILHLPITQGEEFVWGQVTYMGTGPWGDLTDFEGLETLIDYFDGRLNGLASVKCPGDTERARQYLNEQVETGLREIVDASWKRHEGTGYTPPSIVGRGFDPSETPLFEGGSRKPFSYRIAAGHPQFVYPRDTAADWGPDQFDELQRIAASPQDDRNEMEAALMKALSWLGAAGEPDIPAMRIVKIATALETLLGDSGQDPMLSTRSITATLAERCSFLVGKSNNQRHKIHKQVAALYGKRSAALHRDRGMEQREIAGFGSLVWQACRSIVELVEQIPDRKALREWTLDQRYS